MHYAYADPGYEYVGCFIDQQSRDMDVAIQWSGHSDDVTVERCQQKCAGYEYFSLQFASECFCDRNPPQGDSVADGECNMMCTGNSYEACGAAWRNSVYRRNRKSKAHRAELWQPK
jgi:hypothetical protein